MSKNVDLDYSLQPVEQQARRGFISMLVVMLGFTFFSASMWAGGDLGVGLHIQEFIVAVLCGNLFLGIYTGTLASIAAKTGLSTHLLAKYSFGDKGSYLPSFLLAITQIGWFGVGVAMFALPLQKWLGLTNIWPVIILSGLAMITTAYFGIKSLTILSLIAVPLITILGAVSVSMGISSVGGFAEFAAIPAVEGKEIALFTAIGICIASFISGGTLTPDFTRFAKTRKNAVVSTVVAFFIGNSLMFIFGAVGAKIFGMSDISDVMVKQGLLIPAVIVLGMNIWTTNDNALYASGLGLSNITKLPKKVMVLINGIVGTLAAKLLYDNFVPFLSILNKMLPGIGVIIIIDFLFRKNEYANFDLKKMKNVNIMAVFAWACGVAAAFIPAGIAAVNNVIATAIVYSALSAVTSRSAAKSAELEG